MLKLPKGFLDDEEREGFLIESEMKSYWAAQLEVIKVIDDICSKHGLKYFAAYGTLLGAARHNGYIPWDDDVDIGMLRDDYDAFLEIAENEMPNGYRILNTHTTEDWNIVISRIVNASGLGANDAFLIKNHGCPYSVGVDIFPFDCIPDDLKEKEYKDNDFHIAVSLAELLKSEPDMDNDASFRQQYDEGIAYLEAKFDLQFYKEGNMINQLNSLADFISSSYGKGQLLANYLNYDMFSKSYVFHSLWFSETIDIGFEIINIKAPIGVEAVLNICYGNGFMTPKKGGAAHDYPCYKAQREILIEEGRKDYVDNKRRMIADLLYSDTEKCIVDEGKEAFPDEYLEACRDKKLILYVLNSANIIRYKEQVYDKIERVLHIFETAKNDVSIILAEDITFLATLNAVYPQLFDKYMLLRQSIIDKGIGLISDNLYYDFAGVCDAYFGDATTVTGDFIKAGKPVMLQNYSL